MRYGQSPHNASGGAKLPGVSKLSTFSFEAMIREKLSVVAWHRTLWTLRHAARRLVYMQNMTRFESTAHDRLLLDGARKNGILYSTLQLLAYSSSCSVLIVYTRKKMRFLLDFGS